MNIHLEIKHYKIICKQIIISPGTYILVQCMYVYILTTAKRVAGEFQTVTLIKSEERGLIPSRQIVDRN